MDRLCSSCMQLEISSVTACNGMGIPSWYMQMDMQVSCPDSHTEDGLRCGCLLAVVELMQAR